MQSIFNVSFCVNCMVVKILVEYEGLNFKPRGRCFTLVPVPTNYGGKKYEQLKEAKEEVQTATSYG